MKLEDVTRAMRDGLRALQSVDRRNDRGLDAALPQGRLDQMIEIGRDNNLDVARNDKMRDGAMRHRRNLSSLLPVLLGRLDITVEDRAALSGRSRQRLKKDGIVWLRSGRIPIPLRPIRLRIDTLRLGNAANQVKSNLPASRNCCRASDAGAKQQREHALVLVDRERKLRQAIN